MFSTAMGIIFLWLSALTGVYGRGVPHPPSTPQQQRGSLDSSYSELQNLTNRKANVIPEYPFEDSFEWRGPWTQNEKAMVIAAAIGAADMMSVTLNVLTGKETDGLPQGEQDPSFSRYFRPGDMRRFQTAVEAQLGFLGCPYYSAQRKCIPAPKKVVLYHGDGPTHKNLPADCGDGERAYLDGFLEGNPPVPRTYISICPAFFKAYKAHKHNPALPSVPYVDKDKLFPYIDEGNVDNFAALSAAADFMHEMFHVLWIYQPALQYQIMDLYLTRPDNYQVVQGYRGYYAMKIKDPTWNPRLEADSTDKVVDPLYNVDSYVMCILEIFYRFTYKRQPWTDPPDPHGVLPW